MPKTSPVARPPTLLPWAPRLACPPASRSACGATITLNGASVREFTATAPLCKSNKKHRRPPPQPSAMGGVFSKTPMPSTEPTNVSAAEANIDLEYIIPEDVLPQHAVQAALHKNGEVTIPPETQREIVQEVLDYLRGPQSQQTLTVLETILYKLAEGDMKSLYVVGMMLIKHNPDEGARLGKVVMETAAKKRYLDAEFELAQLLTKDFPGSPKNMPKAMQTLASLAGRGHALSQYVLGARYLTTGQDLRAGLALLEKAAASGQKEALTQMGRFYHEGLGKKFVTKDVPKAIQYLEDARQKDSVLATFYLGTVYALSAPENVENPQLKAYELYLEAASKGLPAAQHNLGSLLFQGAPPDVPRDALRAIEYWTMAAESKHPLSQINLAKVYMDGLSDNGMTVKKDYARAERYLRDFIERRGAAAESLEEEDVTDEHTKQAMVLLEQVIERKAAEKGSWCVVM
ncbi:hypothetical protein HDU87_007485 [Geranomyces variabilis]|uniref:HCP-like protein n=1 Tax=Geranomyces variabilis TaxID=109894 RepID=A0AAD5XPV3_9FUNG|nr:hypothetical protein HDU87_007485 [Geranomyces variabilis]